ncbi:MAG: extracellular solute-binding protein [Defluviitaleaceae bacterium]|nr:extracellular solute-binding protein [Defluviitaleaceae bacterium]
MASTCNKILRALPMVLAIVVVLVLMLAACNRYNNQPGPGTDSDIDVAIGIGGTTLVVYSTFSSDFTAPIIEMFEERYNVSVELYTASTTHTLARLRAEAANPQADLMWGGSIFAVAPQLDLFGSFTSINEPFVLPSHKNTTGVLTSFTANAGILIINTDMVSDIEINGYLCLLNPALRGRIAIAYPSATPTSFCHLTSQLYAMGSDSPHTGWEYINQLVINIGGIILPDSAAVHRGVLDGDFIVGLTYEDAFLSYAETNAHIKVVYIDEGVIPAQTVAGIVNGAINREGAEAFIDFITSYEVQTFIEANLQRRAVRSDVQPHGIPVANTNINWVIADAVYIIEHRETWVEQFWDIWMTHN